MKKLYIKQKVIKITDHYPVLNEHGDQLYRVDQDFKLIGNRVKVTSLTGRTNFTIKRGIKLFLPKYRVNFADGKSIRIRQNLSIFRRKLSLYSRDYDLDIRGDIFSLNFKVYNAGRLVGEIYRKWLAWGDTFVLTVHDDSYEEEILAIFIAVDEIIDMAKRRD